MKILKQAQSALQSLPWLKKKKAANPDQFLLDADQQIQTLLADTSMHTIGGMLMNELRHLPKPGESIIISGYRFTVDEVTEKTIQSIIIEPV